MNSANLIDNWNSGAAYESYVGRWSRLVATEFVQWLNLPSSSRWLDLGCGSGALTQTILRLTNPSEIKGVDHSPAYVAYARTQFSDPRASFEEADAQQLPFETGTFDAVVSGLVLNFIPDQLQALREMVRVTKPSGTVAAYVWDYAGQMQMMRYFWDAVTTLHPDAAHLDEGPRFPICQPEPLAALFASVGLHQAEVRGIEIQTRFRDFADYWTPFLGGQGSAPTYLMSLPKPDRVVLRDHIQAHLPINADGSFDLIARVWAVRARRTG